MPGTYDWWRNALHGEFGPIHDGDPQAGFYRKKKSKAGGWTPVAIWLGGDGKMVAKVGDTMGDAYDIWTWVCRNPVAEAIYRAVIAGQPWPDEAPVGDHPGIGHNLPDDPVERAKLELVDEREKVKAFLATPIADEDTATKSGRWAQKMADLAKRIDALRVERKKPHDDAAKAVQAEFKPLIDGADDLSRSLKKHMEPWLRAKAAKAAEEARIKAEAERKAAESLDVPVEERRAPAREPSKIATGGVTLATRKVTVITDIAAAAGDIAARVKANPEAFLDFQDAVRAAAHKVISTGQSVPGAEHREVSGVR